MCLTEVINNETFPNESLLKGLPSINQALHRYPHCIVWTPISLITDLISCIYHSVFFISTGIIHDFTGAYYVGIDDMAFGWPCKYVPLKRAKIGRIYNDTYFVANVD